MHPTEGPPTHNYLTLSNFAAKFSSIFRHHVAGLLTSARRPCINVSMTTVRSETSLISWTCRSRGGELGVFEGAQASPEHTSAPSHRQKHPLEIKEKLDKMPCHNKIWQKYNNVRLNLGTSIETTAIIRHYTLNWMVVGWRAPLAVSTIDRLHVNSVQRFCVKLINRDTEIMNGLLLSHFDECKQFIFSCKISENGLPQTLSD